MMFFYFYIIIMLKYLNISHIYNINLNVNRV